jgi:hypothetical protein
MQRLPAADESVAVHLAITCQRLHNAPRAGEPKEIPDENLELRAGPGGVADDGNRL